MGDAWEMHGRCGGVAREVHGRCTGGAWEVHGRCTGGAREVHGRCMGMDRVAAWGLLAGPGVVSLSARDGGALREVERYIVMKGLECRLASAEQASLAC